MQIETGYNKRCVARAIRTTQLALGINPDAMPDIINPSLSNVEWIAGILPGQFPNRTIHIWYYQDSVFFENPDVQYEGEDLSCFIEHTFDDSNHIVMFAFSKDDTGHMVIGLPAFGYDLDILLVIAIDTDPQYIMKKHDE